MVHWKELEFIWLWGLNQIKKIGNHWSKVLFMLLLPDHWPHSSWCICTSALPPLPPALPLSVFYSVSQTKQTPLTPLIPQDYRGFILYRRTDHTPSVWQYTVTLKGVHGMFPFKCRFGPNKFLIMQVQNTVAIRVGYYHYLLSISPSAWLSLIC